MFNIFKRKVDLQADENQREIREIRESHHKFLVLTNERIELIEKSLDNTQEKFERCILDDYYQLMKRIERLEKVYMNSKTFKIHKRIQKPGIEGENK